MKIFIVTETLLAGGAEWFALRLCKALTRKGHQVYLYVLRPDLVDKRLTQSFTDLHLLYPSEWKIKLAVLVDRITNKIAGKQYCCQKLNSLFIKKNIKKIQPDVLHSHLITSDLAVINANKKSHVYHVTTIHGDYIQAIKNNYTAARKKLNNAINALDHIVSISDEQINILTEKFPAIKAKLSKVYNGYQLPEQLPPSVKKETFVFGLIARGIPQKGWEPAIKSFIKIKSEKARLYFYGESEYLNQLRQTYPDNRIVFAGFSDAPLAAVSNLDVGLLPSYYNAESLPTTIIEYLAMSKPIIATAVGEIPKMIEADTPENLSGILIKKINPTEMIDPLYEAMNKLMTDTDTYKALASNCNIAFKKFAMDRCVDAYLTIYKHKTSATCAAS